ncbi:hypothetical protein DBR43_09000 [Pedobacter sp. KBW06]|uniref:DUF6138 family protein n=1 Tax=Pedobacter sp. KBW06 TaxID=2153359 RepID=UPI000F5A0879|nr:DUF6138 family protein [Pedobacter sp. KBW06]RQO75473.1 hypothetical protein DBR43_09000 [Pedobacter sp. KBW06]
MNRNYNVTIEGNEALLERFIEAILTDAIKESADYPHPLQLPTGELFLVDSIIKYFLNKKPFIAENAIQFCDKIRKNSPEGFQNYSLEKWIKENIQQAYFDKVAIRDADEAPLKSGTDLSDVNPEHLSFVVYVAICLMKYGASFEIVTVNRYFRMVKELGSNEVEELKKYGSKKLPEHLTNYKDENVSCVANDVFATIKIKVSKESEAAYQAIFQFINELLKADFPKSYTIEFSAPTKNVLPVKGLIKTGVHHLFANGVQYPNLHPLIESYALLAMKKWEWYHNLQDENCAMPSTFAVFALGLENEKYFDLVKKYMQEADAEHQSIQEKFTPAFVEKFGISKASLPVFISCILSMQEHKPFKVFAEAFHNVQNLQLLLDCKRNFADFISKSSKEDWSEEDAREMPAYLWTYVLYSIWGPDSKYPALIKKSPPEMKAFYEELLQ